MFRSARPAAADVSAALGELPTCHVTYQHEGSWLVVGPTGVFVVTAEDGDLCAAAEHASAGARRLRTDLATELAWVPFVDAIVATRSADAETAGLACLAVPAQHLAATIAEGPRTVDDETLARITRLRLAGLPAARS